jgi:hypothetical protein
VIRRLLVLALIVASLPGCAYLTVRHPETGDSATCGRLPMAPWYPYAPALNKALEEGECIEALRAQGYDYVAGPDYGPDYLLRGGAIR